jgi:predicted TIM-barrel fold metal-dependent hydrolase
MIVDAHLHCSGTETCSGILKALDEAHVDRAVLLAPFVHGSRLEMGREALNQANEHLSRLVQGHEDRLIGFAVVNPLDPNAPADLEDAVERLKLRGLKLAPAGWYPYDEPAHRVYERAAALGLPILFHSGIFIDGRSARFCRPAFYEAVREHRTLRVTLAHLGWPWTDEAIAVGLIDLLNGMKPEVCQIRFDLSFGPPPIYRREALERALAVLGPGLLQFGSDRFLPCSGDHIRSAIDEVRQLLADLNVDEAGQRYVMGETAARWLGLNS